jgi:hypothetical protein
MFVGGKSIVIRYFSAESVGQLDQLDQLDQENIVFVFDRVAFILTVFWADALYLWRI